MMISNAKAGRDYDTAQLSALRLLAVQCPYQSGTVVYMAREILMHFDTVSYYNECEIVRPMEDKMMLFNNHKPGNIPNDFKLYPNPNNGSMTLEYHLSDNETGIISIYDVTGKLLKSSNFNGNNTSLTIDANTLDAGAYYYEIKINGNKTKTDKLIIIK